MTLSALSSGKSHQPEFLWRNGKLVAWSDALIHVNAVGHASVSAVFEGIKAYRSADSGDLLVFRLHEHMQRLLESARIVRLAVPYDVDELCDAVLATLRANRVRQDTYIRPWSFARGLIREQIWPAGMESETVVDTWPFTSSMLQPRGCRVAVSSWRRINDTSMPPRAKVFSNYHNSRLATMEATRGGYDWPLFLNGDGKVTEGPGSCVALVRNGRLITPSLSSGVLESITRATVLQLAAQLHGLTVEEREVDRTELYLADELFFMGTGWEILPIVEIDGLKVGSGAMGPITARIDRSYHDAVRGSLKAYRDWCTPVWNGAGES